MTGTAEPVVLVRREDLALRLFAFPHAGGNPQIFADWALDLPGDVELVSFAMPGRGRLLDGAGYDSWPRLVADLIKAITGLDDGAPFAFFGHSFGALVAFEVCRKLAELGRRTPEILFLSAHRAPHLTSAEQAHTLPEPELLDRVRAWGLVPEEHLQDEELMRLMLPPLRGDLALDATYPFRTGAEAGRLAVPVVVYGGTQDRTVRPAELHAWQQHVEESAFLGTELFDGGHFYTISDRAELLASLRGHLDRARAAVPPSWTIVEPAYTGDQRSLWDRFEDQVAAAPDALALLERDRQWSYRELHESARSLAAELTELSSGHGDVLGLLLPHSAEYCISLLTCFGLGAPACLLEKNWPVTLLAQFLRSAGVRVVVTVPELIALLPAEFQQPDRLIVLGPDRWTAPAQLNRPTFPAVAPTDIALISMTSGTSGTPKAVLNTHLGCLYCFDARYESYPYGESSRDGLNVFFGWECLRPLLQGRPAVVIPDDCIFDPVRLVSTLAEHRITRIVVPPSLFESVLDHPSAGPAMAQRLDHLEVIFLMGEVVPGRVVDKAAALLPPHVKLVNAYSTWESLDVSFADLLPRADAVRRSPFAPVGRILAGSAAILLNDKGEPVPYGGVGELHFAGPGVASGYLNDPAKTAERFVPCPSALAGSAFDGETFYRTGDRARFLPGGDLEILGRTGEVVKVRGFKVSLRAVEHVLESVPGVARVIVRPVLDARTNQPASLLAYVLGEDGAPSKTVLARVGQRARRDLPEYARPRRYLGLAELPLSRSDSRKLDLSALPVPPPESEPIAVASLTTVEQRIAQAWHEVLGDPVGDPDANFFEVGGDSLSAARLSGVLAHRYGITLPVIDVFQFSSLRAMAAHCSGSRQAEGGTRRRLPPALGTKLAVVGMAGRFPGAPDIETFWQNLTAGVDSLTAFEPGLLRAKGLGEEVLGHPKWVPAGQVLDDADKFDAGFWGIGHREAVLMDPQHRVFLEIAWAALEQAGYARRGNPYRRRTGVFAACGIDGYLVHHLDGGGLKEPLDPGGIFLTEIGNEKDYIATRVAYQLDLGGPAFTVTSACSSALVAVAQAAQSILAGQCEMAIAGASAINFPNLGYCYEDGLVGSVDGTVRPFDDAASGTLFGDSVGAVVLKRLDDAIADGDQIWAVLTGFGISNDGSMKAGYTAPSALAQSQCISDAIEMAGITSEQISYVECHATATHIGDAIEVKGLLDAFVDHRRAETVAAGSCALGSVKGNIGHANCAAGITGFIKTVLCLHHRTLVPTVHYRTLNPKLVDYIDCDGSPFTIQQSTADWAVPDPGTQLPRRAGVSSFGIGGTNAHVIMEEAPAPPAPEPDAADRLRLVPVSARSETAFGRNALALADALDALPPTELGRTVRALQTRREAHPLRGAAILTDTGLGADTGDLRRLGEQPAVQSRDGGPTVVFCFAGQGSQAAGMARGLYRGRADGGRFRRHFDAACASLARHLPDHPTRQILDADEAGVTRPVITQCGLFAVEYAIAHSLLELGIRPAAVAGHSIGEYAAAELAGLLSLDEAAELVAARALATEQLPSAGGMLSVLGDQDLLADWLARRSGLWRAAENAPGQLVLAGTTAALRAAATELPELGFLCRSVPVSHPFHSDLMTPVADRVAAAAARLSARVPTIPFASNLTGTWFDSRYQPAGYWPEHVTSPVRWREDLDVLLQWEPDVVLEIGPGSTLTGFARKCLVSRPGPVPLLLASMPGVKDPEADDEIDYLRALGELWCQGAQLDFTALEPALDGAPSAGHRLPTYSFDRTSFWTRPEASVHVGRPAAPVADADVDAEVLVRYVAKPAARLTLYCLPYAGGNAGSFRAWALAAPDWLDLVAVQLPGRPGAEAEADGVVLDRLATAIRTDAGERPVAFCGLSFGAALGLDLLSGPLADWGFGGRVTAVLLIGRAVIGAGAQASGADCSVEAYLMAPGELGQDEQWRQAVLPALTADLSFDARSERRVAQRQSSSDRPLLDCPVQVQCGIDDPSFPSATATDWGAVTASPVTEIRRHEGAHDFMLHRRAEVLEQLVAFLDRMQPQENPVPGQWQGRLHQVRWSPLARRAAVGAAPEWLDLDEVGTDAAAEFLRARLTAPDHTVALASRLGGGQAPAEQCERFRTLLTRAVTDELRGSLVLVLPALGTSGMVGGLTRALALEEPGLTMQRLYLPDRPDAGKPDAGTIDRLLRQARAFAEEPDLLARGGHLLARRLLPVTLPDLPAGTLGADEADLGAAGGSYLLIGGTGGIGRVVVDWLIQHQGVVPSRVIVTGRAPSADLPAGVRYLPLELDRPIEVDALAARTGPLAGLLHLAGTLDDGILRNLTEERFARVLAPKVALGQLMDLARAAGAPWLIAFSSTSALLGAGGQANYAAANGWLDAHADWSQSADGPQLISVNWGTWAGTGMAAGDARTDELARAGGETPLSPGTALQLLGQLVGSLLAGAAPGSKNLAACELDWPRTSWAGAPLIRDLPAPSRPVGQQSAELPDPAVAEEADGDHVRSFLRDYIHSWDESKRLVELGLDSLDFARMRGDFARRFGMDVPLAVISRPNQRLSELHALLEGYRRGPDRQDEPELSYAGD
ncbi:polyketide synthase [Jatrophihabitans lederbergiae]|uniref:AMP-binding protein n=1 Tax=Jatrophihabitans lederbergiae TaxID=3075547 RepID=A0ABU2JF11_9ACTN|nr:polyketide synthase [Jatrophihabitans sp. DSM 44399]MDT0263274.1 AMP-binding protein [Jatrophihabitans sp. DSM 44399]